MEVYSGPRKSGKTTRAILWLLQNWEDGIIVCADYSRTVHTIKQARELTGLSSVALNRRIIPAKPEAVLTKTTPKNRFLLDDIQDFHPMDRQGIEQQREVVAYTCSP